MIVDAEKAGKITPGKVGARGGACAAPRCPCALAAEHSAQAPPLHMISIALHMIWRARQASTRPSCAASSAQQHHDAPVDLRIINILFNM